GNEGPLAEVHPAPEGLQPAPRKGEPDVVLPAGACNRRLAEDIGLQIEHVLIGHESEGRIGKRGEQMSPIGLYPLAQSADEVGIGPSADAVGGIGADIGAEERAERRLDRRTARERYAVVGFVGMAPTAAGDGKEVGASLNGTRLRRGGTWPSQ